FFGRGFAGPGLRGGVARAARRGEGGAAPGEGRAPNKRGGGGGSKMLKLRGCFSKNPRIYPLMEGVVRAEGIELDIDREDHGDTFAWLLDGGPSDVFEFSISHYMTTFERQDPRWDWTALPIFLAKATPFLETRVNRNS